MRERPPGAAARRSVRAAAGLVLAATVAAPAAPAAGQSVLDRTPNLPAGWVGRPSTLNFNFLHRFDAGPSPVRKVTNTPSFLLGWGFGGYALVAATYTTASDLVPGYPNEWEVLARFTPLSTELGATVGLGLTAAWNEAAESVDGELTATVPAGPFDLVGALRAFSDAFGEEDARWAAGAGAILGLSDHVALAADVVRPFSLEEGEAFAWGAGVQLAIPHTPHTLSLQVANTNSGTLQGSSRRSGGTRWGFELTVPITPSRYFGSGAGGGGRDPAARAGESDLVAGDTVRIAIRDFEYGDTRVVVRPGTYVLWTNEGESIHTVTADTRGWQSPFMAPGESFGRVFTQPGEHAYHCVPHPTMEALLVVEEAPPAPSPGS